MASIDVSILIVNYKTPKLLLDCVASIFKYCKGCSFEVIVVDNDSQDESEALIKDNFPKVKWINAGANVGFGKANNIAAQHANGKHFLLLNSDTELYEDCVALTLRFYQENERDLKLALVGCKIQNRDFTLQPSCNYYYPGLKDLLQENPFVLLIWVRLLKQTILKNINKYDRMDHNHEVEWIGVPFAMISADKFNGVGGFDDDFFMYSEDKELNYRLKQKNFNNYFFAGAGVFHVNGGSSDFAAKRMRQIFTSKLLFILKAKGRFYFYLYLLVQYFNLFCDHVFYQWSKLRKKNTQQNDTNHHQRKFFIQCLNRYAWKIPKDFKPEISSSHQSLNTYQDALFEF